MQDNPHTALTHQFFRLRFTELNEIYAAMSLRTLGLSLIGIFIPIYLYVNHYSLRDIMFLYLMMFGAEIAFEYFSARMIREIGPKHLIAISMPFVIVQLWLYSTLPLYHWPLWLIAVAGGIGMAFFWQAYHYDFSISKHRRKASREVSKVYILLAVTSALAPFLGGVIATNFGTNWLYLVVLIIISCSALPLLKTSEPHKPIGGFDLKKIKIKSIRRDIISYIGDGW